MLLFISKIYSIELDWRYVCITCPIAQQQWGGWRRSQRKGQLWKLSKGSAARQGAALSTSSSLAAGLHPLAPALPSPQFPGSAGRCLCWHRSEMSPHSLSAIAPQCPRKVAATLLTCEIQQNIFYILAIFTSLNSLKKVILKVFLYSLLYR